MSKLQGLIEFIIIGIVLLAIPPISLMVLDVYLQSNFGSTLPTYIYGAIGLVEILGFIVAIINKIESL